MPKLTGIANLELIARRGKNLDTLCYRGEAPLAHLARVSQADIFHQDDNPDGLQRDLSPKHAAEAYEYVHRDPDPKHPRAFPEVVLNVRDKKVLEIDEFDEDVPVDQDPIGLVRVRFDLRKMKKPNKVYVSRVDGNHRLYFGAGDDRRDPLLAMVPFQLHVGLSRDQERSLFVDINANQKGLNTSHLEIMRHRLSEEEREIRDHPDRWMASRLVEDPASPWHGLVHLGGSKKGYRQQGLTRPVNFASLQAGVNRTLAKSQYIHDLTDPHAQYVVVRTYWEAVKLVFAEEWAQPREHLLLKNIGVLAASILGGAVIDRCMARGRVGVEDLAHYLRQARGRFDWGKDAKGERAVTGMSGNRAALVIAGEMAKELSDETGQNMIRDLQARLLQQPGGR